jgi:hypothetical protein
MIEEILWLYFQNMWVISIQNHNPHLDTVHSRGYTSLHLYNDRYSYILPQRSLYRTL